MYMKDMHDKPNEQLFTKQVTFSYPEGKQQQHLFLPISYFKYKKKKEKKVGCSDDHIA